MRKSYLRVGEAVVLNSPLYNLKMCDYFEEIRCLTWTRVVFYIDWKYVCASQAIFHTENTVKRLISCPQIVRFLYYYAAFLAHSCLISPPQWLIDMRKCSSISPDEEGNDTSNKNSERCFSTREKIDTTNQKPQRCVSFASKLPHFIGACSFQHRFANIQRKCFSRSVFLAKRVKSISEIGVE